jgi:microcystin-dependent protein
MEINIIINDRIAHLLKKMFSGKGLMVSIVVLTIAAGILLYAAPVTLKIFNSGDVISAADVNANFAALKAQLDIVEANSNGAPVGSILPFAGTSDKLPVGWLLCDGSELDRTDSRYAALFNVIYDNWGSGDGVTTFNLPDLRGVFLRGSNKTGSSSRSGNYSDPDFASREFLINDGNQRSGNDELVGSFQLDAFQGHTHNIYAASRVNVQSGGGVDSGNWYSYGSTGGASGRTSSESRSKNAAVHYIIKY